MTPQSARVGNAGTRGRGVAPRASRPRPTSLLGENERTPSVEPGDAPLGVRLTHLGLALLGALLAFGSCVSVWACLWLLGHDLFIVAALVIGAVIVTLCVATRSQ